MKQGKSVSTIVAVTLLVALSAVGVALMGGCSSGQQVTPKASATTQPMTQAANTQQGKTMKKMTCPMCNKGEPAAEDGTATVEGGVQIVHITQKNGYYSPNHIDLKAGLPTKLIFTGVAKDCSAKPKVAQLNKQVDFSKTGEATMDLGVLKAGTYKLTCGMDSPGGSLEVR